MKKHAAEPSSLANQAIKTALISGVQMSPAAISIGVWGRRKIDQKKKRTKYNTIPVFLLSLMARRMSSMFSDFLTVMQNRMINMMVQVIRFRGVRMFLVGSAFVVKLRSLVRGVEDFTMQLPLGGCIVMVIFYFRGGGWGWGVEMWGLQIDVFKFLSVKGG